MKRILIFIFIYILLASVAFAQLKTVTDMRRDDVTVNITPKGVYGTTPTVTFLLYSFAPELLVGWNTPLRGYEQKYIPEKYQKLPVIGGWYGQGVVPNKETLLKHKPSVAFSLLQDTSDQTSMATQEEVDRTLKELKIPNYHLKGVSVLDYALVYRELGKVLDMKDRGEALASYMEYAIANTEAVTDKIPADKRLRVFLSLDVDGLTTKCDTGYEFEALKMAGAVNVHDCGGRPSTFMEKVTFEQLMKYDPDVILVADWRFKEEVKSNKRWMRLRAAKEGRLYLVPNEPFSWLDRPASYVRAIGMQWLACTLYPNECSINVNDEVKQFFSLFFSIKLTDEDVRRITTQ